MKKLRAIGAKLVRRGALGILSAVAGLALVLILDVTLLDRSPRLADGGDTS